MSRKAHSPRGTEAPMDYEWTNRTPIRPSWSQATATEDQLTSRKRPHDEANPPLTPLGTPRAPIFGSNQNVPFIFNQNATPRTSNPPPWQPPPFFSPEKVFPNTPEPNDVDMSEASPNRCDDHGKSETGRAMAVGGLRRVYNTRKKTQILQSSRRRTMRSVGSEDDVSDSGEETEPVVQNTSNHYTLNMPAAPAPQSDLPYILLGYLQFLFNLSLILLFLYLAIQFILTVQRDVEQRISEYSMDIVQEIALCSLQYKTNLCEQNAVPAMAQQCENWKTCMNRDPAIVGRARVGAELIAEVVNGFVEPISWKALVNLFYSSGCQY
ncbi:Nucleus export protein BRL1 [Termitomyces sp. J132]|nr:hypothetical protein H2248_000338 [Termitomyces sp. 'cryptogamus']KNZ78211.1 Nucleus export protein BRL1 [Termitomyces sp. J132]